MGKDLLDEAEAWCKTASNGLKAVGSILSLWPALPRAMARKVGEPSWSLKVGHDWHFSHYHNYWWCKSCGCFSTTDEQAGPPKKYRKCQPGRLQERLERAEQLGHEVKVAQVQGVPTFYCTHCAARGSWQWRKLLDPCSGEPRSAVERRWLAAARAGGLELQAAQRAARPKRRVRPDGARVSTRSRKTPPRKAQDDSARGLKNMRLATKEDSLR